MGPRCIRVQCQSSSEKNINTMIRNEDLDDIRHLFRLVNTDGIRHAILPIGIG